MEGEAGKPGLKLSARKPGSHARILATGGSYGVGASELKLKAPIPGFLASPFAGPNSFRAWQLTYRQPRCMFAPLSVPSKPHTTMAYELPKLPYAYDALAPHIDAKTMEIHHTKHHQAYITNANNLLKDQPALANL